MTPTLHLNGTSSDVLLEQVVGATGALRAAQKALENAAPNARDYYPQGPLAFGQAVHAHADRLQRLAAIRSELETLAEAICDEMDAQSRDRSK